MSGLVYTASFTNVAVTLAVDLFHGTIAADRGVELIEMALGQNTDLGDAAEEVLIIGLYRAVTGGSAGAAATEIAIDASNTSTIGNAVLTNNTTPSTSGTLIEVIPWNIRVPLLWSPVPELRPSLSNATDPFAFRLLAAPADSLTISGTLKWQEI